MPKLSTRSPALVPLVVPPSQAEQFHCSVCGKSLKKKGDLNRHRRSHDPKTWTKCPHCDHRTAQRSNLDGHINRKHLHVKPHQCNRCSERFADKSERAKHRKRAHQELADVPNSNAGVTLRFDDRSVAPVVPAASTLCGETRSRSPFCDIMAEINAFSLPIDLPAPYAIFTADVSTQDSAEASMYHHLSLVTPDSTYPAAYSNFTFPVTGCPDSPMNAQLSPTAPYACLAPQPLSGCYTQHAEWGHVDF